MRNVFTAAGLALLSGISPVISQEISYEGPFYMCPDAHGEDQQARFKTIDLTPFAMRIEAKGELTVEGFSAHVQESRTNITMSGVDPIAEAYGKLFGRPNTMSLEAPKELIAVCFAQEAPPSEDIDGPFVFMPGFEVGKGQNPSSGMSSITVPAHLYMVLTFKGPPSEAGDMRYTLTSQFFPNTGPLLGLERDPHAPNLMIQPADTDPTAEIQTFEMWTPILPVAIYPGLKE